jgi:hypothetical protein
MRSRGAEGNVTCGVDCSAAREVGAFAARKLPAVMVESVSIKPRRVSEFILVAAKALGLYANCGRSARSSTGSSMGRS